MDGPKPGRNFGTHDELSDAVAQAGSLWDLAQQRPSPAAHTPVPNPPRSRATIVRRILGVVGILGLLSAIALIVTPGTPVSSRPGAGGGGAGASSPDTAVQTPAPVTTSRSLCSAEALDPRPSVGTSDSIQVSHVPPGTVVTVDLAFAGGSAAYSAKSNSAGVATVLVAVNTPASRPVEVFVTAGGSACSTTLTPTEAQRG